MRPLIVCWVSGLGTTGPTVASTVVVPIRVFAGQASPGSKVAGGQVGWRKVRHHPERQGSGSGP